MNPYLYIPAVVSILLGIYIYRGERKGRNSKGEVEFEGWRIKGVTWFVFMILGIAIMVYASV
jgi:heme/copper-type cytochrome/quinol oxidase subunit 2